ncbi:MAG TPA: hypothetical protein VLL08_05555 [Kineosporiaceae bacterium]|nr:hypothetical protein [Kineosporiaceae bacterium]
MSGRLAGGTGRRLAVPASVGVIGLALLGIGQSVVNRHAIQDDLTTRSTKALKSADLTGLSVSFAGRDATITGAGTAELAQQAIAVVSMVDGVDVARASLAGTTQTGSAPTETAAPAETPPATETSALAEPATPATTEATLVLPVGFTLADGTIKVTGTVGSKSAQINLIDAVKATGKGWKVVDRLNVADSVTAPEPKPSRLSDVTKLLAQAPVSGPKLVIQYNKGSVILRGTPADAAAERALLGAAAATVDSTAAVVDGLDTAGAG